MSGKSRKKIQKPASVSGMRSTMEESTAQFDSQLLSMAAKYRLQPQYLQSIRSFSPPQTLQSKPESSANTGQDSAVSGAGLSQGFGGTKTSPPLLTHNHTVTDATGQKEGDPSITQHQDSTSNGPAEDPSKFTLNPSYNFNQAVLSGL